MLPLDNMDLCRICEKQSNLIDISLNPIYIEQYSLLCGSDGNVSYHNDDGLPQFFCRFCITQLMHAVKFKQKCIETYNKFKDLLHQIQIQIKEEVMTLDFNENDDNQNNWVDIIDDDNQSIISITETKPFRLDELLEFNDRNSIEDLKNIIIDDENLNEIKCDICICTTETEKIFDCIENLELHMTKCHGMATNLRQCEQCGNKSKWFKQDKLSVHLKRKAHTNLKRNMCKYCNFPTDENPHKCEICDKCFHHKFNFDEHLRTHSGERPYKCQYCTKCFIRKRTLDEHEHWHNGKRPYKCEYCTKSFQVNAKLMLHTRVHTGEKPYKCDYCKKCFTNGARLNIHTRIHTGDQPYKCEYCDKSFRDKSALNEHTEKHTGNYKCEFCGNCFTTKRSLVQHIRLHTGEKPYKCELCDECFSWPHALNVHKKQKHTRIYIQERPYTCELCEKCFRNETALNEHTEKHTGKYKCEFCGNCFATKRNLVQHIRLHTGEKPYKCEECDQRFSWSQALNRHKKQKHTKM